MKMIVSRQFSFITNVSQVLRLLCYSHWHHQLWCTGARAALHFQLLNFLLTSIQRQTNYCSTACGCLPKNTSLWLCDSFCM